MVNRSSDRPKLKVTADGTGVAAHAGSRSLADMADALGLSGGLSGAMAPTRQRRSAHDPGRVVVDLAVMVADGGTSLSDLKVLRHQPELFGNVAVGVGTAGNHLGYVVFRHSCRRGLEVRGAG